MASCEKLEALYGEYRSLMSKDKRDLHLIVDKQSEMWAELLPLSRAYLLRWFDRIGMTLPPPDLHDLQVDLCCKLMAKFETCVHIRKISGLLYFSASNAIRDRYRREQRWLEQTALADQMDKGRPI